MRAKQYFQGNNRYATELFLSSTFINLLSLALPFSILQIYDRILPNNGFGTASVLVSGVGVAIFLELLLRYARSWLLAASAARFEFNTTTRVVNAILQADYRHLEKLGSGKIANGLNGIANMRDIYSGQAAVALMDLPFVFIFLGLVAYIGGDLVFIPIFVWLIIGITTFVMGLKLTKLTYQLSITENERSRTLLRVMSGLSMTKSIALESTLSSAYSEINYRRLNQQQKVDWLSAKLQELIQGAAQGTTLLIVLIGCIEVLNHNLTTGGLAACSILAGRAIAPLSGIVSLQSRWVAAKNAMSHVEDLEALPVESFKGASQAPQSVGCGPIALTQLQCKKPGACIDISSLKIPAGAWVTITSSPLSQASLLLSLIAAFDKKDSGSIQIANVEIEDHQSQQYHQAVRYVPTWPRVFAGSILDNMTMFQPELETQAIDIAIDLGLANFIEKLPAGYQTAVGVDDSHMVNQAGAMKLLAIVRALVCTPKILLLNNPMQSLDIESQAKLLYTLNKRRQGMTIIAASHYPSMAKSSDICLHISPQGQVTETASLLEQSI